MFGWQKLSTYHLLLELLGGVATSFLPAGVGRLGFRSLHVADEGARDGGGLVCALGAKSLVALLVVPELFVLVDDACPFRRALTPEQPGIGSLLRWVPTIVIAGSLLVAINPGVPRCRLPLLRLCAWRLLPWTS